jgi:hypothetical protein
MQKKNIIHCKLPCQRDTSKENFGLFDVGPVSRQLLTRADDFFRVLFFLTLTGELTRSQVPK